MLDLTYPGSLIPLRFCTCLRLFLMATDSLTLSPSSLAQSFACSGLVAAVFGLAHTGSVSSPLVPDSVHPGFLSSLQSVSRLGTLSAASDSVHLESTAFSRSLSQSGLILVAIDSSHPKATASLKSSTHLNLAVFSLGLACLEPVFFLLVLDFVHSGLVLAVRSLAKSRSLFLSSDSAHTKASLTSRVLAHAGLALAMLDSAHLGLAVFLQFSAQTGTVVLALDYAFSGPSPVLRVMSCLKVSLPVSNLLHPGLFLPSRSSTRSGLIFPVFRLGKLDVASIAMDPVSPGSLPLLQGLV